MRGIFLLAIGILLWSCKEQDIVRFDYDKQMVRFKKERSGFSFKDNPAGGELKIPIEVVGRAENYERTAKFVIVDKKADDAITDFPLTNVEIVSAVVPAGATEGTLTLRFTQPTGLEGYPNFTDRHIYLRSADGGDFVQGPEISTIYTTRYAHVYVSAKRVMPESWPQYKTGYLGHFSPRYYEFIIDNTKTLDMDNDGQPEYPATGYTEFPMQYEVAGINGGKLWSGAQRNKFLSHISAALAAYNAAERGAGRPPLLHDSDDDAFEYEVVIGQWVYPGTATKYPSTK